jgi:[protein-PII] uridylyltransferase
VRTDLAAALDARIALPALLEERERQYARYRRASAAAAPQIRVTLDNTASAVATVVEVRAADSGPVLYELAKAVADTGLTITRALINTLGAEVIDVFYVQTLSGGRVVDADAQRRLMTALEAAL